MLRNFILTGGEWWLAGMSGLIGRNEIYSNENGPATRIETRGEDRRENWTGLKGMKGRRIKKPTLRRVDNPTYMKSISRSPCGPVNAH
jgi:hypothetical protein